MASWPGTLPARPLATNFQEIGRKIMLRTEMDAGPAKMRRRFTAAPTTFRMSFTLTKTEVADLDTFYFTTTNGGVDEFDWNHPRTDAAGSFRFVQPPTYQPMNEPDLWRAVITVELMP